MSHESNDQPFVGTHGPIWSVEADFIRSAGQWLQAVGVRNWALNRAETLAALERLGDAAIAVAGGDTYRNHLGVVESTYDSWYCDAQLDEPPSAYVARSIDAAARYVIAYPNPDGNVLFALVPANR